MERPSGTTGAEDLPVSLEVDATGLACPMPVIELARAVQRVDVGDLVLLSADDPTSRVDVPVWCRMQRQTLRATEEADGVLRFWVERTR